MSGKSEGADKKHVDELIAALEATTKLIQSLVDDMQDNSELW